MPVPNNNSFSLLDVKNEIESNSSSNVSSLISAFEHANNDGFNPAYVGNKNSLRNFRNYQHITTPPGIVWVIAPGKVLNYNRTYSNVTTQFINIGTSPTQGDQSRWNTSAIIAQPGHSNSAASNCRTYVVNHNNQSYTNWDLPCNDDWDYIYANLSLINSKMTQAFGFGQGIVTNVPYWSSTERSNNYAWYIGTGPSGSKFIGGKSNTCAVRAIKTHEVSDHEAYALGDTYKGGIIFHRELKI